MSEAKAENGGKEKELIEKIVQDEYFKYLVEKEVEIRTQEKLGTWWKRVAAIVGVILGVLGFFGLREYGSFQSLVKDVEDEQKDLEGRLAEANNLIARASTLLSSSEELAKIVSASVTASKKGTEDSMALVTQSLGFLADSRKAMDSAIGSFEERQKTLVNEAQEISRTMQATVDKSLTDLKTTEHELVKAKGELSGFSQAKQEIDKAYLDIKGKIEEANAFTSLATELNKAKTFSFFMLGEDDTRLVEIADYQISFTSKEVAESVDLHVQVQIAGAEGLMPTPQIVPNLVRGSRFPINHTNGLWCEVNSIRFRWFGPDFVFLRIFAR